MIVPRRWPDIRSGELERAAGAANEDTVRQWEAVFAAYTQRKHAIALGSGRQGMALALQSLRLAPLSEVIVPAYTLKDLLGVIRLIGLVPVCADIDRDTFNVTAETVARRLTARTGAVLATHLFGNPCPIREIVQLADDHGVKVIEDCAHSAGGEVDGRPTGAFGHAAFFSFETAKPINTYGGGMVVTDCDALMAFLRARIADVHDMTDIRTRVRWARLERMMFRTGLAAIPLYTLATEPTCRLMASLYRVFQHAPRYPRQFSAIQAALGLRKLGDLHQRRDRRAGVASRLQACISDSVRLQAVLPGARPSWYYLVGLIAGDARVVRKRLLWNGIDAGIRSEIAEYCPGPGEIECPNALEVYTRAIHLPLHEAMTDKQITKLASVMAPG